MNLELTETTPARPAAAAAVGGPVEARPTT
jgi:hypothetical protein